MHKSHKQKIEKHLINHLRKYGFNFYNLKQLRQAEKCEDLKAAIVRFSYESIMFDLDFIAPVLGVKLRRLKYWKYSHQRG